mmetsp:Transcript_10882/g.13624  ORF Transcript_10882/g.13624 Transcript_10882/m.13624 type:complete len:97 (-) Transcript_10882:387-677(-)
MRDINFIDEIIYEGIRFNVTVMKAKCSWQAKLKLGKCVPNSLGQCVLAITIRAMEILCENYSFDHQILKSELMKKNDIFNLLNSREQIYFNSYPEQ